MRTELRYAHHPEDAKHYDTTRIRKEFLIEKLFIPNEICLTYTLYDRYIVGGAMPLAKPIKLEPFSELKSAGFLDRREMGIINIGGEAIVQAGGITYPLNYKEALYLGKDVKDVSFASVSEKSPAKLYINSAPAHHAIQKQRLIIRLSTIFKRFRLSSNSSSSARCCPISS